MSEETSRGHATKDAFANALMKRLEAGEEFANISIRMLAEDCEVDRQTFYYHFKNTLALADYAYKRKIDEMLDLEQLENDNGVAWRKRAEIILGAFEKERAFRESVSPLIDEGELWGSIAERIESNLHSDYDDQLEAYGLTGEEREISLKNLSFAIGAVYIAWARRLTNSSIEETVDCTEHIRNDFLEGTRKRLS